MTFGFKLMGDRANQFAYFLLLCTSHPSPSCWQSRFGSFIIVCSDRDNVMMIWFLVAIPHFEFAYNSFPDHTGNMIRSLLIDWDGVHAWCSIWVISIVMDTMIIRPEVGMVQINLHIWRLLQKGQHLGQLIARKGQGCEEIQNQTHKPCHWPKYKLRLTVWEDIKTKLALTHVWPIIFLVIDCEENCASQWFVILEWAPAWSGDNVEMGDARGGRNVRRGGNLRRSEKRGCEDRRFEKRWKEAEMLGEVVIWRDCEGSINARRGKLKRCDMRRGNNIRRGNNVRGVDMKRGKPKFSVKRGEVRKGSNLKRGEGNNALWGYS